MKKEYLKPEMMISLFDTKDVITDSVTDASGLSPQSGGAVIGDETTGGVTIPYGSLQ